MWVDPEVVVRTVWQDRVREAERERRAAQARQRRAGTGRFRPGHLARLRQAAGYGLVRTGLRLLDAGRA